MKKIKKIFACLIGIEITYLTKIRESFCFNPQDLYGPPTVQKVYDPPTLGTYVKEYTIPVILFIIGLFALFSKKIGKKIKIIIISGLVIAAIFSIMVYNAIKSI